MDSLTTISPRLHREGFKFVIAFAVVTLGLFIIWLPLGWLGFVLTVWCIYFFRDPDRHTPTREGLVISPADGIICYVGRAAPPPELEFSSQDLLRISVFMDVFNCHVNRSPVAGTIARSVYRPGKFLNASLDKASDDNERQGLRLETDDFGQVGVVQIAGLVARRIVCDVREGQELKAGERFGMIRFGSRVDVYLDPNVAPLVTVGQTSVAGETVFADRSSTETARTSEVR